MEDESGDFLHAFVLDFVGGVGGLVVVFVDAGEVEDGGDAVFGEVVVVAAVIEAVGVVGGVVGVIEQEVGVAGVGFFVDAVQVGAEAVGADDVDVVGVALVVFVGAADHVHVDVGDGVFEGEEGVGGVVLRAEQALFFARDEQEKDAAAGSEALTAGLGEGFGDFEHGAGAGAVVVGAVVDGLALLAEVVVMSAHDDDFVFQIGIQPFHEPQDVGPEQLVDLLVELEGQAGFEFEGGGAAGGIDAVAVFDEFLELFPGNGFEDIGGDEGMRQGRAVGFRGADLEAAPQEAAAVAVDAAADVSVQDEQGLEAVGAGRGQLLVQVGGPVGAFFGAGEVGAPVGAGGFAGVDESHRPFGFQAGVVAVLFIVDAVAEEEDLAGLDAGAVRVVGREGVEVPQVLEGFAVDLDGDAVGVPALGGEDDGLEVGAVGTDGGQAEGGELLGQVFGGAALALGARFAAFHFVGSQAEEVGFEFRSGDGGGQLGRQVGFFHPLLQGGLGVLGRGGAQQPAKGKKESDSFHGWGFGWAQVQAILFTRRAWRPPSKGVFRKTSTMLRANSSATMRAGMASMLASLCWRARAARVSIQHRAQRMPACLLAVMATPLPLPQTTMPNLARPSSTACAAGCTKSG